MRKFQMLRQGLPVSIKASVPLAMATGDLWSLQYQRVQVADPVGTDG